MKTLEEYVNALTAKYPGHDLAAYVSRLPQCAVDVLMHETYRCQREHGFDATPGEDIALIHSEASEALEDIRTESWEPSYDEKLKPLGVASELADIVIRVFAFAQKHNLDLADMIVRKMVYNETRPFKHGGKVI